MIILNLFKLSKLSNIRQILDNFYFFGRPLQQTVILAENLLQLIEDLEKYLFLRAVFQILDISDTQEKNFPQKGSELYARYRSYIYFDRVNDLFAAAAIHWENEPFSNPNARPTNWQLSHAHLNL